MFTEIGIENFKSFGKMQRIPLKPITLLYGPNSSGKSSLMQSLLLLKQTLEESGDDQIVLLPKGNLVDLGGFQEFIHRHDDTKNFSLSVSFKYAWALYNWVGPLNVEGEKDDLSLEFSFGQDKSGEIYLKSIKMRESCHFDPLMEWKNIWDVPHLKRAVLRRKTEFEKNGKDVAAINKWLSDLKKSVLILDYINLNHSLVKRHWEMMRGQLTHGGGSGSVHAKVYSEPEHPLHKDTKEELIKLQKYLKEESQKIEAKRNALDLSDLSLQDEKLQEKQAELLIKQEKLQQLKRIMKLSKIIHCSLMHASSDFLIPCSNQMAHPHGDQTNLYINLSPFSG